MLPSISLFVSDYECVNIKVVIMADFMFFISKRIFLKLKSVRKSISN